jgi:tetratricopeptide (TPR) repeat protein
MSKRLAGILVGCAAVAASGCPNFIPEKSAREWMADGRAHSAQARWEDAIADFTEVLRLEPESRDALVQRARASEKNGDMDQALEDCKAALKLQPNDIAMLRFRAAILRRRGQLEEAGKLDLEANRLMPSSPAALYESALREMKEGNYASAQKHFEGALIQEPHNPIYLNDVAWLEAACPQASVRDGPRAVVLAMEACQLTQWSDPLLIDTLAAAYAETGQFDQAIKLQQKARDLAPPAQQEDYGRRLKVYQEGRPYRFVNGQ